MTNFKIGPDEISEGLLINDSQASVIDEAENPIAALAEQLGVDPDAIQYAAMQRALRMSEAQGGLATTLLEEIYALAGISSAWLDGFFAALHIIEQKISSGDLTAAR